MINHQPIDAYLRGYAKENLGETITMLSDPDQSVSKAYGVTDFAAPEYAIGLVDRKCNAIAIPRMRRWTFYFDADGVIRHIDKDVLPTRHGEDVIARIKTLGWAPKTRPTD